MYLTHYNEGQRPYTGFDFNFAALPRWALYKRMTPYNEGSFTCNWDVIVATIRVEPSVLLFFAFISKSVNNQCYNPYYDTFPSDISFRAPTVFA